MSIVTNAERLATEAHAGQTYNGAPYVEHCRDVVGILMRHGVTDHDVLAAAWLHDVLEDTRATEADIDKACDAVVTALVYSCTGVGKNRRERNESIAEKLEMHPAAIPIKVADRIANVTSCWANRDSRLFMYHREYREFRAVVYGHVAGSMLMELDALMGWRP